MDAWFSSDLSIVASVLSVGVRDEDVVSIHFDQRLHNQNVREREVDGFSRLLSTVFRYLSLQRDT